MPYKTLFIIGILSGITGFLEINTWPSFTGAFIGCIGIILTFLSAYCIYLQKTPYELMFDDDNWHEVGGEEFELKIPPTIHRKGTSAKISVFHREAEGYNSKPVHFVIEKDRTIRLASNFTFPGKVVIQ